LKLSTAANDNFKLLNNVLRSKGTAYTDTNGDFYIENNAVNQSLLKELHTTVAYSVEPVTRLPQDTTPARPLRIALWDTYGGSMKSGWMRWLLEDFDYDFDVIYNPDIDRGALRDKYDVIIFPGGGITSTLKKRSADGQGSPTIPEKYRD